MRECLRLRLRLHLQLRLAIETVVIAIAIAETLRLGPKVQLETAIGSYHTTSEITLNNNGSWGLYLCVHED